MINDKLVVVDLNTNTIHPVFSDLPKEIKSETPKQVKTIVWIKCESEASYFRYSDGTKGIETNCELTFIDFVNKRFLWRDTVSKSPPDIKPQGSDSVAPDPSEAILRYLKQIDHKE